VRDHSRCCGIQAGMLGSPGRGQDPDAKRGHRSISPRSAAGMVSSSVWVFVNLTRQRANRSVQGSLRVADDPPGGDGKRYAVTADVSRTRDVGVVRCSGPGATVRPEIAASLLRQRFEIFGGIAPVQPAQPRRGNPMAQFDNVHSVLRLNYETL
jgi:hypothetical protein